MEEPGRAGWPHPNPVFVCVGFIYRHVLFVCRDDGPWVSLSTGLLCSVSSVSYMTSLRLHALGEESLPQREMPEEANTGINQQK